MNDQRTAADKMSEQLLVLYKARLDDIGFLKRQQWSATNYLTLIYAAIVWLGLNPKRDSQLSFILSAIAVAAAILAIALLLKFQCDLGKLRSRNSAVHKSYFFTDKEREVFDVKDDPNPYQRGGLVLIALISVAVVGAILVVCALNRA
jgi:hypothetical protein